MSRSAFLWATQTSWQEALPALKNLELHLRPCKGELEARGARLRGQSSDFPQPCSQLLSCLQSSMDLNPLWLCRASASCFLGLVEECQHGAGEDIKCLPGPQVRGQPRSPAQLGQCLMPFGTLCPTVKLTGQLCLLPQASGPHRGLSRRPAPLFMARNQRNDFQSQATYTLLLKRVYSSWPASVDHALPRVSCHTRLASSQDC